jgi:hypothetical protein
MSGEDPPEVPVRCTACETTTRVPLPELAETVEAHNERVHDGEEIATVDPEVADRFADLVAEDLGLLEDPE